jgi:hypothetical protein
VGQEQATRFMLAIEIRCRGVPASIGALRRTATTLLRASPLSLVGLAFLAHGLSSAESAPNLLLTYAEAYFLEQSPEEKEIIAYELEGGLLDRFPTEPGPLTQYLVTSGAQCIANIPIDEPEKPMIAYCLYDYVGTSRTATDINQTLVIFGIQITSDGHGNIESLSVRAKDLHIPKP